MKYYLCVFLGALLLVFPTRALADISINEVAWMGTTASQYSEWIELYNSGSDDVSLAGWKLFKAGDALLFTLSKTITAGGYLLVERTTASAPDAVPGINDEAGTFSAGGLKNSGDDLILKDKDGTVVQSLSYSSSGWPAGDAKTKDTMQWNGQKWITAPGTPDALNAKTTVVPATPVVSTQTTTQTAASPAVTVPVIPVVSSTTPTVTSTPVTTTTTPLVSTDDTSTHLVANTTTDTAVPTQTTPVNNIQTVLVPVADPISSSTTTPSVSNKKTTSKKIKTSTNNTKKSGAGTDTAANDNAADQLAVTADTPKENNHIKIIILVAVAFIGMALFLLLEHSKASKE